MADSFAPRVGGIPTADIAVPEYERELRFYSRVLGTGEPALWREDLMNSQGVPVIGLGARGPEYEALPLQWMPHIQVADVAASADRALGLGGRELMHGRSSAGESEWAVLLDPDGAAFGIIPVTAEQAPAAATADSAAAVGCIAGIELTVPDAAASCRFYREVIGWAVEEVALQDAGGSYTGFDLLGGDGKPAAILRPVRGEGHGLPLAWLVQLTVGDLDESLRRVVDGGGKILEAARAVGGEPRHPVIEDPVGACLALVQGQPGRAR